jgi:ribonuclease HIII
LEREKHKACYSIIIPRPIEKASSLTENILVEYQRIRSRLEAIGYSITDPVVINFGLQFHVTGKAGTGLIRLYTSKKLGIKVDMSQVTEDCLANGIAQALCLHFDQKAPKPKLDLSNLLPVIGTDESGKGDYFGPLVVASVHVDETKSQDLKRIGVKDSKLLSDGRAKEISEAIQGLRLAHSIIEITPEKYNLLYDKFKKENKNLNSLLGWAHAKAIEEVLSRVECETIISDQFGDEKYITSKLQEKGRKSTLIHAHRAEENIAVAAASILARARFLDRLKKLSLEFGVNLPKGASESTTSIGKAILLRHGRDGLAKVAKLHFANTIKIYDSISEG